MKTVTTVQPIQKQFALIVEELLIQAAPFALSVEKIQIKQRMKAVLHLELAKQKLKVFRLQQTLTKSILENGC